MRTLKDQIGWCRRVHWALAGGLAGALALTFVFGYRPVLGRQAAVESKIAERRLALESGHGRAEELPQLMLRVEKLQAQVERTGRKLPRQPELGQFIKDITAVSQQTALRSFVVQPLGYKRADAVMELPICMTFEGDFASAAQFLRQVEEFKRLTRVRRLNVRAKDGNDGTVQVELTLNIYFSEG